MKVNFSPGFEILNSWCGTQMILDAWASVQANPATPEEEEPAQQLEELPVPMLEGNWESASDTCLVGVTLAKAVIDSSGWEYLDESRTRSSKKLGFVTNTSGSVLKVRINTAEGHGSSRSSVSSAGCLF